LIGFTTYRAT